MMRKLLSQEKILLKELEKCGISAEFQDCCPEPHTLTLVFPSKVEVLLQAEVYNGHLAALKVI